MNVNKTTPTTVYALSILGFLMCCCAGLGFIPSLIAFIIAKKKIDSTVSNTEDEDISPMKTAKTLALIALIVNVIYFVMSFVIYIATSIYGLYDTELDRFLKQY